MCHSTRRVICDAQLDQIARSSSVVSLIRKRSRSPSASTNLREIIRAEPEDTAGYSPLLRKLVKQRLAETMPHNRGNGLSLRYAARRLLSATDDACFELIANRFYRCIDAPGIVAPPHEKEFKTVRTFTAGNLFGISVAAALTVGLASVARAATQTSFVVTIRNVVNDMDIETTQWQYRRRSIAPGVYVVAQALDLRQRRESNLCPTPAHAADGTRSPSAAGKLRMRAGE